jgi:hypothetical protein
LDVKELGVVADRGHYRSEEIRAREEAGITAYVPKPLTSNNPAKGQFGRDAFRYLPEEDAYECPTGERLTWRMQTEEKGRTLHLYWAANCLQCPIKAQCTSGVRREMTRRGQEKILDRVSTEMSRHVLAYNLKRRIRSLDAFAEATRPGE